MGGGAARVSIEIRRRATVTSVPGRHGQVNQKYYSGSAILLITQNDTIDETFAEHSPLKANLTN